MDESWKRDFRTVKKYEDGSRLIQARDYRYRGFSYWLGEDTTLGALYDAFETFKGVADGTIECHIVDEEGK